jgi:hypothetical protein
MLLTLLFLGVMAIINYQQLSVLQQSIIDQNADVNILQNKIDHVLTLVLNKSRSDNPQKTIKVRGMVKKEQIPVELELGEYWYWLYFNEPFLLEENATGVPVSIDKIQVLPPWDNESFNIDNFLNIQVEIDGTLNWGYAESKVLQIITLTEL